MPDIKKSLLLALKISIGSSLAIGIASWLKLDNAVSAGTITLLTLMTTKWEAVRVSFYRVASFVICLGISWLVFLHMDNMLASYGVYLFLTVLIAELLGWRATISVNAVIGAHFFITHDFSMASIINEWTLVLIGVVMALILSLFRMGSRDQRNLRAGMKKAERDLQEILGKIADYLLNPDDPTAVWDDIQNLENRLHDSIRDAYEYQENSFRSHPEYYIDYFEMRYDQCQVLQSLHSSMTRIRSVPEQAEYIAEYLRYLSDYVSETNNPDQQDTMLEYIMDGMRREKLPENREEFETRAVLYHILTDLKLFLEYKQSFYERQAEHISTIRKTQL